MAMSTLDNFFETEESYLSFPKPVQKNLIISSIIHQYYSNIDEEIIIDKSRNWPKGIHYIENFFKQQAKIIVTVRDIDEILTSMIVAIRRDPFKEGDLRLNFVDRGLVNLDIPINDDNRCEYMATPGGFLGRVLQAISQGIDQGYRKNMHFVEYKDLVETPKETLKKIYDFLGEEYYEHSFTNISNDQSINDKEIYGISNLHTIRPDLRSVALKPTDVLSPITLQKCQGMDFWRHNN